MLTRPNPQIAPPVPFNLRTPIDPVAFRAAPAFLASVPVPEATMNQDDFPEMREYKVWAPRQIFPVQTKPEPYAVNHAPDGKFRASVLAPDTAHDPAAFPFADGIHL